MIADELQGNVIGSSRARLGRRGTGTYRHRLHHMSARPFSRFGAAGDAAYNDVHQWLVESNAHTAAADVYLVIIELPNPRAVIAGQSDLERR